MQKASELEWLKYFYDNCDFGPAHEDVVNIIKAHFIIEEEKNLPDGYLPWELEDSGTLEDEDVIEWSERNQ